MSIIGQLIEPQFLLHIVNLCPLDLFATDGFPVPLLINLIQYLIGQLADGLDWPVNELLIHFQVMQQQNSQESNGRNKESGDMLQLRI